MLAIFLFLCGVSNGVPCYDFATQIPGEFLVYLHIFFHLAAGECMLRCMNGGKCVENECSCTEGYTGAHCGQREYDLYSTLSCRIITVTG